MASQSEALLSVRGLRTHFVLDEGTDTAVDGVDFDVHMGKTLGVVGESGCGKSVTAFSILRMVEKPGRVVGGEVLLRRRGHDGVPGQEETIDLLKLDPNGDEMHAIRGGEVAIIFQEPMTSLSPVHTIGDQIVEAVILHQKVTRRDARGITIELLRQVGIPLPEQRIDAYSFQLSGGLRQRAMIAMALSCNPSILIADEPTTALDVTTQAQILDLIRGLQRDRGMALILITHDLGVIAEMADDVAVMYLGKIVEKGPVDDIFHNPKHPYTQALLASIPSILSVPKQALPSIAGSVPHPYNRPKGCTFHPRCPHFMPDKCDVVAPTSLPVGPNHEAACYLYEGGSERG